MLPNKWSLLLGILWEISGSFGTAVATDINWGSVSKDLTNALEEIVHNNKEVDHLKNILTAYPDAINKASLDICISEEDRCNSPQGNEISLIYTEYRIVNEVEILNILDGYAKLKDIDLALHRQLMPFFSNPCSNAHTPLVNAIQVANNAIAKRLIAGGVDLNIETPLCCAIKWYNADLAALLLENGADVNKGNPLCIAIQNEMNNIAVSLINHTDINVNAVSDEYGSPLAGAIYANNYNLVTLLLEKKATVSKNLPLHMAIQNGMNELIIPQIKKNVIDVNTLLAGETLLSCAIAKNNTPLAKFLIENGANVQVNDLFHLAARKRNYDILKLLIDHGAHVNEEDPLYLVLSYENYEIAKFLIENGANINKDNLLAIAMKNKNEAFLLYLMEKKVLGDEENLLGFAIQNKMNDFAEYLINFGNINIDKNLEITSDNVPETTTFLCLAIKEENNAVAQLLIRKKADANKGNPLHFALQKNNYTITKLLIENGANVDDNNILGIALEKEMNDIAEFLINCDKINKNAVYEKKTLLQLALSKKNNTIAKLLIEKGAHIDSENPLCDAITYDSFPILTFLVERGVDVNKGNPLGVSIDCGKNDMAAFLINCNKVDKNALHKGKTPIYLALEKNAHDLVKLLIEGGADLNGKNLFFNFIKKEKFVWADILLAKRIMDPGKVKNISNILLRLGVEHGNISILEFLLSKPELIDISARGLYCNLTNATALYAAIYVKKDDAFLKLLIAHADKNTLNQVYTKNIQRTIIDNNESQHTHYVTHRNTALGCLLQNNIYHLVQELVEKGADPNIPISLVPEVFGDSNIIVQNFTPLYLALERGKYELALLMIGQGANVSARCSEQVVLNGKVTDIMKTPLHLISIFVRHNALPKIDFYDEKYREEFKKNCKQFGVDPNDEIKKTILQCPTPENIDKLCALIKEEQNRGFKKSLKRILETIGDDGNPFAQKALFDLNIWPECWRSKEDTKAIEISKDTPKDAYVHYTATSSPEIAKSFDEYLGRIIEKESYRIANPWIHSTFRIVKPDSYGWKLHISSIPSKAQKVAEIVLPFCIENKMSHKILCSMSTLLAQYNYSRFPRSSQSLLSQRGKYIVIYPSSDKEAEKIVQTITEKFQNAGLGRKDFVYVHGDFRVGPSGGIYTRFCTFSDFYNTERGIAYIDKNTLKTCAQNNNIEMWRYQHPFQKIGLWHREVNISPKTVFEIMSLLKRDYNFELDMFLN
ncbi:MAG: ankyrin repeat domain-containing protein [Holosporaceae bacterium]|jgi:ankyrin repeat protein|nr:ankyrin repeat domain-containing protein [Holosporaceae bacterium]